jgi:hypothetical protein
MLRTSGVEVAFEHVACHPWTMRAVDPFRGRRRTSAVVTRLGGEAGGRGVTRAEWAAARHCFAFDRSWEFAVPPEELWDAVTATSSFGDWWPWLRDFDPVPLVPGSQTSCSIGPPLPYVLAVDLLVVEVVAASTVAVLVSGDVDGPARLDIEPRPTGASARLVWELEVRRPLLRAAARVARPVLLWGHEWVVRTGVEQFRRAALVPRVDADPSPAERPGVGW